MSAGEWALVRVTSHGDYSPYEVVRENKRHAWLRTGLGETRFTLRETYWRFPSREAAVAEMHRLDAEATAHIKKMQGRA